MEGGPGRVEPLPAGHTPDGSRPVEVPGYRIESVIGRGGHGTVYRATALADNRAAAIKVADAASLEGRVRLGHEAGVLRLVGPPHVPAVFAEGQLTDGSTFLAMELIAAPTLAAVLAETEGGLPRDRIAGLAHA